MMIFGQNRQAETRSNRSYAAEQLDLFWTKRAFFEHVVISEGV